MTIRTLTVKRALAAAVLGSVALTAGCSAATGGDKGSAAVEQSLTGTPPGTSTPDTEGDPSETVPAREMIGTREVLSPDQLVTLFDTDKQAFERYFTLTVQDMGMSAEEAFSNPREFADRYVKMMGQLDQQLFMMLNGLAPEAKQLSEEDFLEKAADMLHSASGYSDKDTVNPQYNGFILNEPTFTNTADIMRLAGQHYDQPIEDVWVEATVESAELSYGGIRMVINRTGQIVFIDVMGIQPRDLSVKITTHALFDEDGSDIRIDSVPE